ncbi:uncharacterized protein LOC136072243 [Hydra vulgaris]|uniref:uncharacterized protein LOC136072243 n=1 Tax=Hydra vulgaris TaxID=6087 RepID=UPI0032EA5E5C
MTPAEASNKKNENKVWLNLNSKAISNPIKPKFSIGDKVRIIKKKGTFEKGYTPRWTEEVFTVSQVQYTDPPTYKITDYNNEEIQGNKSFVKWYGYPDTFNSWVDNTELKAI